MADESRLSPAASGGHVSHVLPLRQHDADGNVVWEGYPPSSPRKLAIRPVTKTQARQFVTAHHRHNEAPTPQQVTFVVGLFDGEDLVGVATAGQPIARLLADGMSLEINRTCVSGDVKNANSMLYGAICRAAKALGYQRVITYTLQEESGASLRAAGFTRYDMDRSWRSWQDKSVARPRHDYNLFGERQNANGRPKYRWERQLQATEKRVA